MTRIHTNRLYSFLKGTIRILVIEHDKQHVEEYERALAPLMLYSITGTTSAIKADRLLGGPAFFHMCISELEIGDHHMNEYTLLRRYGSQVPFLFASRTRSLESGYEVSRLGAKAVVAKQQGSQVTDLLAVIHRIFLDTLITPKDGFCNDAMLTQTCQVLASKLPASVDEWAWHTRVDASYLRKRWRQWFHVRPKHGLFLYTLYANATAYCERLARGHTGPRPMDAEERKRKKRYFLRHIHEMEAMLYKRSPPRG
jgi:hypothetical protein